MKRLWLIGGAVAASMALSACDMSLGDDGDRQSSLDDAGVVAAHTDCRGVFFRGDNWMNKSTDAGFTGGLWSEGAVSTAAVFEAGYDAINTSQKLPVTAAVKIEVEFDGANAVITQTIDGKKSFTINTASYPIKVSRVNALCVGLGGENELDISEITVQGEKCGGPYTAFKPSGWNAVGEFKSVLLLRGQKCAFYFKQPTQGGDTYKTWGLALWGRVVTP